MVTRLEGAQLAHRDKSVKNIDSGSGSTGAAPHRSTGSGARHAAIRERQGDALARAPSGTSIAV